MAESPSLSGKLEAIKQAQAQKAAEAGKALEEDKAREVISEAQTEAGKEDALRTELNVLEGDFTAADKESLDAGNAIVEAEQMLADSGLDAETQEAIKAVIEEGNQKLSEFAELRRRKQTLTGEIAALNKKSAEGGTSEKQERLLGLMKSGADVKVLRSNGELESGWKIAQVADTRVVVMNQEIGLQKDVSIEEFLSWQEQEVVQRSAEKPIGEKTPAPIQEAQSAGSESSEATRRKELVEGIRGKRADEREKLESLRGKVYTKAHQILDIEEAKARKGEVGRPEIAYSSINRSNVSALLEAGLLTPEDIINEISELAYKYPDKCQDVIFSLPRDVIGRLHLNDRKHGELIGKLVKQDMEYVDERGAVGAIQALGLLRLPKAYELNESGAMLAGFGPDFVGSKKWQDARDAIVASYDGGVAKGNLLIGIEKIPELMFDAAKLEWLNREQIMKWLKDSSERWRGTANESTTVSKTLELQEEGYISEDEAGILLEG